MLSFKISIKGLDKSEAETKIKLQKVLRRCMFKMEELALEYAPVDISNLRMKIQVLPEVLSNYYILKSSAAYSASMEYGTRPFYAPIEPLKGWARRKLGDEKLGYAVQKSIAKKGIKAHPYFRPAFYEVINFWYPIFIKETFSKK